MPDKLLKPGKAPCKSCPYRRDVPSGIWDPSEYEKLTRYDGETFEQLDGTALFLCHQQDGNLCAGWVGCHDPNELLALRLHARQIDPSTYDYVSPVPLFASGAEAAEHGLAEVDQPGEAADKVIRKLTRQRSRRPMQEPRNG